MQVLNTMYEHLIHLDPSIILHETSVWLESGPATTRTIKLPLELNKAVRGKKINEELISQFTEVHNESKRDGNTVTYLRFCMQTTRAISEIMRILSADIRRHKSNVIIGISKTREIVDVIAGWLQGCDPLFLSATIIEQDIRKLLVIQHGEDNVPSFYVKKAFESIWVNQKSEKSAAPVVKVCCEASGNAKIRFMLSNLEFPEVFTKFVSSNEEKAVKWALLNDHIDILSSKSYIIMRGPAITCRADVLKEKGTDNENNSGSLGNLFKKKGMLPLFQEGIGGRSIFAQVPQEKLQEALVYLTSNFVDVKDNDWKIIEKTVKRDNMVKGAVKANVPAVFATTNRSGSPIAMVPRHNKSFGCRQNDRNSPN
jgi:hypothetical protein